MPSITRRKNQLSPNEVDRSRRISNLWITLNAWMNCCGKNLCTELYKKHTPLDRIVKDKLVFDKSLHACVLCNMCPSVLASIGLDKQYQSTMHIFTCYSTKQTQQLVKFFQLIVGPLNLFLAIILYRIHANFKNHILILMCNITSKWPTGYR